MKKLPRPYRRNNQRCWFDNNKKCKIYSGYITLESTKTFYSNIEKNFVPSFNICDFLCDDERINKVKTEIIEIKSSNLNTIKLDELHLSSIKLKQMEQMAEDLLIKTKMQYRANATTYALVIMATVIISYVAYVSFLNITESGPYNKINNLKCLTFYINKIRSNNKKIISNKKIRSNNNLIRFSNSQIRSNNKSGDLPVCLPDVKFKEKI